MVTIVDYKAYSKENGENFYVLIVQGGVEAVKSQETGRTYLTARKANVPCTFNEITCKGVSVQDLAAKCNFEKSNMSRLEAGRVNATLSTLNKVSAALKVDIVEFFK